MNAIEASDSLGRRLEQFLSSRWGNDVRIQNLARIPGGASRETYRFDAETKARVDGLILRRDPVGSLIDTDRAVEFLAYQSFHGTVPVPEPIVLELDGGPLQRPFFIMRRIDGGFAARPFEQDPYGAHAPAIGEALFSHLGRIARRDPAELPLAQCFEMPDAASCWRAVLD